MASTKRDAVRAAQRQLQAADAKLVVDGWWGRRTEGAYNGADQQIQRAAVKAIEELGFTLEAVRMKNVGQTGDWITRDKAVALAERAAGMAGISSAIIVFYLHFEPAVRVIGGQTEYNVEAIAPSGLFRGLFQMGSPAWQDARTVFPEIGSFNDNWRDPWLNALAAAGFAVCNMRYAKQLHKYNGPFTPEIMYAMHNQGHTFIASARRGQMGMYANRQSGSAQTILATAARAVQRS